MTVQWYIAIGGYISVLFGVILMYQIQKVTREKTFHLQVLLHVKLPVINLRIRQQ
jgi:hypothetical protein